jgi:small-conductance mechanosensitive channel
MIFELIANKAEVQMKFFFKKVLPVTLAVLLLITAVSPVHALFLTEQTPLANKESVATTLDLANIIPMASNLPGRLALLKNRVKGLPDITVIEKKFSEYQERVEDFESRLDTIKDAEGENLFKLTNLVRVFRDEKTYFEFINRPLVREIRRVVAWKTEWVEEKNRWNSWKNHLVDDRNPEQIKSTFAKAQAIIDTALNIIQVQLETMLQAQANGAEVKAKIDTLEAETRAFISASRADSLLAASPRMFSPEYFGQFRRELWHKTLTNLRMITLPDFRFVVRYGWLLVSQWLLIAAVILIIFKNRQALNDSEHWAFLAESPIATGIFLGILTVLFFPQYKIFPLSLLLVNFVAGGISVLLLLKHLLEDSWKKQAAFGVIILFVLMGVMATIKLPLPLLRLYTLVASLLGLYFFWRWSRESIQKKDSLFYFWLLNLGFILSGCIAVMQIWGMDKSASYIFGATLTSLSITLVFILFMYIIQGILNWIFHASPVWNIKQLRSEAKTLVKQVGLIINSCIVVFALLPSIFAAWGLYEGAHEAVAGFLALGFNIGSQRINLGLLLAAAATLYVSFLLSWSLPKVIMDEKVAGASLERGGRISISRLIQYFIIFIGFLVTIMLLGLDLTKLTIILSALGVGIGFGLQGIVNNFISGLILLFEQPVRVGDRIEITDNWAEIKKIGLRATTVRTFDESEVIIPNANLVSNEVTNWTLSNRQARIITPVGVVYGSDIPLVIGTLMACAEDHEMVAKSPPPQVLFRSFGESSLDFELRVWINDVNNRLLVSSELHQEIDRRFREANIEIAFPQRDLHLRSMETPVIVQPGDADQ